MLIFHSKLSDSHDSRDHHRDGREMREKQRKSDRGSGKSNNHVRDRSPLSRGRRHGSDKQVYVSNIPYEYRWQDLKDLFRDEGKRRFLMRIYFNILIKS